MGMDNTVNHCHNSSLQCTVKLTHNMEHLLGNNYRNKDGIIEIITTTITITPKGVKEEPEDSIGGMLQNKDLKIKEIQPKSLLFKYKSYFNRILSRQLSFSVLRLNLYIIKKKYTKQKNVDLVARLSKGNLW